MNKRQNPLLVAVVFLLGFYAFLKLFLPYIGGWLASQVWFEVPNLLTTSGREVGLYMTLAIVATWCWATFDEERWREFNRPIQELMRWKDPRRAVVLAVIPVVVGGIVFAGQAFGTSEPTSNPIRHPTPPDEFSKLENPYRNPTDEMLAEFDAALSAGDIDVEHSTEPAVQEYAEAKAAGTASAELRASAYNRHVIEEGRNLFMINCRPCHGTRAMGDGPMSVGQRREPANFTGVETIATLVEGAVFWRVNKGGVKLPNVGSPWESAMPRWETDLSEEQIWKIILAEYDIAGNRPREPEGREEGEAAPTQEEAG